jgi:hypothetical protein
MIPAAMLLSDPAIPGNSNESGCDDRQSAVDEEVEEGERSRCIKRACKQWGNGAGAQLPLAAGSGHNQSLWVQEGTIAATASRPECRPAAVLR